MPNLVSAPSREQADGSTWQLSRARIRDLLVGSVKEIKDSNRGNLDLSTRQTAGATLVHVSFR